MTAHQTTVSLLEDQSQRKTLEFIASGWKETVRFNQQD
jgi:hypothetical protein